MMRCCRASGALVLLLGFAAVIETRGATRTWVNPGGGVFSVPGNWQGSIPPSNIDTAHFFFPFPVPSVPVTFSGGATNDSLRVRTNVLFDLNGNTYQLTNPNFFQESVIVGDFPGTVGSLTITDGTLQSIHGSIADAAGSTGAATVSGAGASWISNGFLRVGSAGNA